MRTRREILIAVLFGAAIGAAACSPRDIVSSGGSSHDRIGSVQLSTHNATVLLNDTLRLTASVLDTAGVVMPNEPVTWQSSDTTVSTVASSGTLKARKVGHAKVVASAGGSSDTANVVVATMVVPVSTVTVVLNSSSLNIGQTSQAVVTLKDSAGDVLTGPTVAWSSGNTTVATVDGSGVVTAKSAGTAVITATSEGQSGSATLTVNMAVVPVATVSVSLNPASINVGQTSQAVATLKDSAGSVLTGRAISWSSGSTSIATIDGNGLVTAKSAGSTVITGTSEGKSGSATLAVKSSPQGGCASPQAAWIWCDDFEQDHTSSYFEYVTDNNSFVRTAGVGRNGSMGMRAHFAAGQVSAGALRLAFGKTPGAYFRAVDAGTANYRELYYRVYVKNQSGWIGGGGDKLMRAIVFSGSDWSEAAIGHVWSGSSPNQNYLVLDPVRGTDTTGNVLTVGYNDFAHFYWLGSAQSQTPIFDAAHVGQWYCVEAHMKLNTPGQSDGVLELRINGNLEAQRTGMNFLGSYQTYGINAVFLENYWNAGSPQAQERYFDDFVVSTQPIGCS